MYTKIFNKHRRMNGVIVSKIILTLIFSIFFTTTAFAHSSPPGCTGSGLGISLFASASQVHVGDVISYSVLVFDGGPGGPVVCDATGIQASLTTPDGVNHPISLVRTSLSDAQSDFYPNVVTYTAASANITPAGLLTATASDTGVIHQNVSDSMGGANQGLNVTVLSTLHVIKQVINNNSGSATASSFSLHVKHSGSEVAGSPQPGTVVGTSYSLEDGTYVVSEDANAGYSATFSGDCNTSGSITLAPGDDKTCTITNDDIPTASIKVIKIVTNNDGRSKVVADFPLFVNGTPVISGATNIFPAGSYSVTETPDLNYSQTFSGDCDLLGHVTIAPGDNKICTITNDDIPPAAATINVVKIVVNDNGGTKIISDFPLFVSGTPVASGATNIFPAGPYVVTETTDPNYIQTFSGDCDLSGGISLLPGDNKFCIITNDDIPVAVSNSSGGGGGSSSVVPPLIDVVKVPTPLALPGGPGMVMYTYTLSNIGKVAVRDITMVGDTCNPINLISGDINSNERLDLNEVWVYTCKMLLSQTHTNTVTATGWANGISAVDVASATVIVGLPIVPPIIHVTKVPNPLSLPAQGGLVTYTETITNPGTVPLSNVNLTDDKCAPVHYISGDANGDSKLDTTETWVYTCQANLSKTTTNIASAEGTANGMTAKDFATVVVLVSLPGLPNTGFVPLLPNTGFGPRETGNVSWSIILPVGIMIVLLSTYLARKKRAL